MIDPDYLAFWETFFPRWISYDWQADVWHERLAAALSAAGLRFADLRADLDGIHGTYRKIDGHWTECGVAIADRVRQEFEVLVRK